MPLPPPSAEAQVAFLQDVQRLLAEGSFTATYVYGEIVAAEALASVAASAASPPSSRHGSGGLRARTNSSARISSSLI